MGVCGSSVNKDQKKKLKDDENKVKKNESSTKSNKAYQDQSDEEIKMSFDRFDKDNSGKIDRSEMAAVFKEIGIDFNNDDVINGIAMFDKDKDGEINFSEFLTIFKKQKQLDAGQDQFNKEGDTINDQGCSMSVEQKRKCLDAFLMFDKDGNGQIDEKELKSVMSCVNQEFTDKQMKQLYCTFDENGDKKFNFDEFCNMLKEMDGI